MENQIELKRISQLEWAIKELGNFTETNTQAIVSSLRAITLILSEVYNIVDSFSIKDKAIREKLDNIKVVLEGLMAAMK